MSHTTEDLRPGWFNLLRRMQAAATSNRGYAVITVRTLIGPDGLPVCWSEPQCIKLEPISKGPEIMRLLTD